MFRIASLACAILSSSLTAAPVVVSDIKGYGFDSQRQLQQFSVLVFDDESGKVLAQADLTAGADAAEWAHQFDATENWDGAMELVVLFEAEGKTQQLQTGLDYSYPVATITGIGSSSTTA